MKVIEKPFDFDEISVFIVVIHNPHFDWVIVNVLN